MSTTSKVSVISFCLIWFILLSTYGTSSATVTCTVKIDSVRMTSPTTTYTGALVFLRNTTGSTITGTTWTNNTVRYFYLSKPLGSPGMAVILTALSNKTKVTVSIGGTALSGSLINWVAVTQIPQ